MFLTYIPYFLSDAFTITIIAISNGGSRPSVRGGGGPSHPDPEVKAGDPVSFDSSRRNGILGSVLEIEDHVSCRE